MTELVLREPLASLWRERDAFAEAAALAGVVVRHKEGRETIRCTIDGAVYYRKFHRGVGWWEILKNLIQLRRPVVDASNEWLAINRLTELGIATLSAVAYGRRGANPATRQSFLITRELTGTLSTAEFTREWPNQPPPFALRRAMIARIATICRQLHGNGINHRDLYLCHFLLDLTRGEDSLQPGNVDFFVVDLHRAQLRPAVPRRWLVKDIASIYFSALDIGLGRRDVLRFLRVYYDAPLRQVLADNRAFFAAVRNKARKLYLRDFHREPVFPL